MTKSDDRVAGVRLFITTMITNWIGRHDVLLPINHKSYILWEKKNSQVTKEREHLHEKTDKGTTILNVIGKLNFLMTNFSMTTCKWISGKSAFFKPITSEEILMFIILIIIVIVIIVTWQWPFHEVAHAVHFLQIELECGISVFACLLVWITQSCQSLSNALYRWLTSIATGSRFCLCL